MDKNSKYNRGSEQEFLALVSRAIKTQEITEKVAHVLLGFFESYKKALASHHQTITPYLPLFYTYLEKVIEFSKAPYPFEPYHQKITEPFDYNRFGIDFLRPLVFMKDSYIIGKNNVEEIAEHLKEGHNVIFFANHQIEPDPQAISILFEPYGSKLLDALIFVAGDRVITDPIAIPFSLGINLLCIFSKRYIDHPPEKKEAKLTHNSKTMKRMKSLLDEGGKAIYVAVSGGRDRKDASGLLSPAPFDPQSVEMFHLMGRQAKKPTFFYPMALFTYTILPPPETIQKELGEPRLAKAAAIRMGVGGAIDMDHFPGSESLIKEEKRAAKASYIHMLVCQEYDKLL